MQPMLSLRGDLPVSFQQTEEPDTNENNNIATILAHLILQQRQEQDRDPATVRYCTICLLQD